MKNILLKYGGKLVCILFLLNIQAVNAQLPGGGNDPNPIPIDGGASILAAAGVAYGVKKYRDYRKNTSDQEDEM